ncbi:MAG TPA: type II toxin-antitoxin system VapC family toxin [Vicinamibacterales bacterium]|nr:type II toxin-antitoxin system VapC family toxin [Vicinamibacterales bacterium]
MSVFVVDASVVIKWFVPEVQSEAARRWLDARHQLIAPDLLFPEVGNTVWKKTRRGELTTAQGRRLARDLSDIAVEVVPTRGLLADAHELAQHTGLTVYDAMYVALAVRLETQVVTADERLRRTAAQQAVIAPCVRMVQDFTA